ncbi:DUF6261 family protein [Flaviaesturariibacter aridisoli]|uniref:Uncharacterized protein n=1 Tax=Flaviaesturariibacter aridisoli TaxID=2545761 RepID=A0A4V2WMZ1_9BACT|nr:DUF6261 family protein [Flaviaesturariibacter aridisoli]TCZ73472.1 hypothetical protein E0486_05800 [Flaviaesturariibacter aridisoli]
MLQQLYFERLPQAEALRYLEQFIRVIRAGGNLSDALSENLTELEGRLQEGKRAFRQATGASQSGRMEELEAERDGLVSGLGKICDGHRMDPDAACKLGAQKLHDNLRLYGGAGTIIRMTVKAETTTINSFLRDWREKPGLAAAVAALGLQRWADHLQTVNTEYDTLSIARGQERASQELQVDYSVKDKLTEARPLYEEVATHLNAGRAAAKRLRQDDRPWLNAIGAANAITEEYSALLAARATQAEKAKAAEAASGTPGTDTPQA